MFTAISWATYGTIVAVALAVYYLFVGFKYYFSEAKAVFKKKSSEHLQVKDEVLQKYAIKAAVQELAERLVAVTGSASADQYSVQQLKQTFQGLLKEYPVVKNSPERGPINKLIVALCNDNTSITLHEEEVELLWNGIA